MKQAEDTKTIDMYNPELGNPLTHMQPLTEHHVPTTLKTYYRFYVKSHDGLTTEWCGLTRKQARDMYAYTNAHQPSNVIAYGWEETK